MRVFCTPWVPGTLGSQRRNGNPRSWRLLSFKPGTKGWDACLSKWTLSPGSSATFSSYLLHGRAGRPCPLSSALQPRGWAVLSFPHSDSQPFVTLGPRNPLPSSGLHKYQKYTRQTELIQKKKCSYKYFVNKKHCGRLIARLSQSAVHK